MPVNNKSGGGELEFPTGILPLPAPGSPDASADVVVAGAGPVGLLLGCLLKQAGVDVALVDPRIFPGENAKAALTMARSMELLESVGAAEGLRKIGRPVVKARLSVDGGKKWSAEVTGFQSHENRSRQQMLAVGQDRVEDALLTQYLRLGGRLYRAAKVTDYKETAQGVNVEVERAVYVTKVPQVETPQPPPHLLEVALTTLRATFLVGCDGAHSTVRKSMRDVPYEGKDYQQSFLLSDVDIPEMQVTMLGWNSHALHIISDASTGTLMYLIRCQGRRWRFWYTNLELTPQDMHHDFLLEKWQALMPEPKLLPPTHFENMSLTALCGKLAGAYRRGHVFLAGDAAHSIPALDGQGMNLGLQDAGNLAWKLAEVLRGKASDLLLDSYEAERRPVATEVLANTDRIFSALGPSSSPGYGAVKQAAIKTMLCFVSGDQVYDREKVENTNGLGLSYMKAGTCREVGLPSQQGALRAGSRLPDLECNEHGTFRTVHTLQLLSEGPSFAVLRVILLARCPLENIPRVDVGRAVDSVRELIGSIVGHEIALYACDPSAPQPWPKDNDDSAPPQRCCLGMFRKGCSGTPKEDRWTPRVKFEALGGVRVLTPLDADDSTQSPCGELCTRFGLSNGGRAILVVRPDGYVAVSQLGRAWEPNLVASALEELGLGQHRSVVGNVL